jgi:cell division GTPase FtsZ
LTEEEAIAREHRFTELEGRMTQIEKDFGEMKDVMKGARNFALMGFGSTITGFIVVAIAHYLHW